MFYAILIAGFASLNLLGFFVSRLRGKELRSKERSRMQIALRPGIVRSVRLLDWAVQLVGD